jgi:hypothetical protein
MTNRDEIVNGYHVLADKLDERYLDLTIKQYTELKNALEDCWKIVDRRGSDRRSR